MAKAFTVKELRNFQTLKSSLEQAIKKEERLRNQITKLESERQAIAQERQEINARLNSDYAELLDSDLFTGVQTAASSEGRLAIENTEYVTRDKKKALLAKILRDAREAQPGIETISYTEVKNILQEQYNIETKSIANFFTGLLSSYQTTGGNRNKAIVLPTE